MKLQISAMTAQGPKAENQDDLVIWMTQVLARKESCQAKIELNDQQKLYAALADGVSSSRAARLSAQTALDALIHQPESEEIQTLLSSFMDHANEAVCQIENDGACTLNCAVLTENAICFANIGDSPIYLIRDHKISQLAQIQTAATIKRNLGIEEITLRDEHMLINFIGNPHLSGSEQMYLSQHEIRSGDIFILCSDGVSDALGEDGILKTCLEKDANAQHLIAKASLNAQDNISAIMICII